MSTQSIPEPTRRARYLGDPVMTQREVAAALGIPYQEVFYIERVAFKKLRRALIRRLGSEFFEAAP